MSERFTNVGNVVSMEEYKDRKTTKQYLARAAYWELRREDAWKALERAEREREKSLRLAGMLPEERGVDEETEESRERLVREEDDFGFDPNQLRFDYGTTERNS